MLLWALAETGLVLTGRTGLVKERYSPASGVRGIVSQDSRLLAASAGNKPGIRPTTNRQHAGAVNPFGGFFMRATHSAVLGFWAKALLQTCKMPVLSTPVRNRVSSGGLARKLCSPTKETRFLVPCVNPRKKPGFFWWVSQKTLLSHKRNPVSGSLCQPLWGKFFRVSFQLHLGEMGCPFRATHPTALNFRAKALLQTCTQSCGRAGPHLTLYAGTDSHTTKIAQHAGAVNPFGEIFQVSHCFNCTLGRWVALGGD
jgi:hypothetical protein